MSDYWREAFLCSLEEAGLSFPDDDAIAKGTKVLEGAHECYGMSHGYECIQNPLRVELDKTEKLLKIERSKIGCGDCGGSGRLIYNAGPWGCNQHCSKCNGEGKYIP